jgi:membrane protein YqaA with SNARE-associated domain
MECMDLRPHLDFLASHPYAVVFWSSLVEAAGVPFPSRVILILTPAFLTSERDLIGLIVVATVGAVPGIRWTNDRWLANLRLWCQGFPAAKKPQ